MRIRSAVWAMLLLWVIMTMVCSYFRDASFSREITSLVFWVSRFPVGSSARIKAGRVIKARPIGYTLLLAAGELAWKMVTPFF